MLQIGCSARAFQGWSVADTAARMQKIGFRCTELCFVFSDLPGWVYNGMGDMSRITSKKVKDAVHIFRESGVDVTSLGMFTDLRNPDPDGMAAEMDYVRRHIELAAEAGIPYLASECGFTPGRRGINADTYEADYARLKESVGQICLEAEQAGVRMALEACMLDIIPSPRRLKTLIEELESATHVRLGALLDPANFIAVEDEEGIFRHLKHDIYYFHGKDRKINAAYGVNVGDGDIDWIKFMELYIRHTDRTPFILEYCSADTCADIKTRVEDFYDTAFHRLLGRIN